MPRSDPSIDTASYDGSDDDDDDDYRLAQKEWQESMEELQQLALVLVLPWLGKFLGRKTSHWRASFPHPYQRRPHIRPSVCPLPPSRSRNTVLLWRQTTRIAFIFALNAALEIRSRFYFHLPSPSLSDPPNQVRQSPIYILSPAYLLHHRICIRPCLSRNQST